MNEIYCILLSVVLVCLKFCTNVFGFIVFADAEYTVACRAGPTLQCCMSGLMLLRLI